MLHSGIVTKGGCSQMTKSVLRWWPEAFGTLSGTSSQNEPEGNYLTSGAAIMRLWNCGG